MSKEYLKDPVKRKMAAQALANAGLYKAGDSINYIKEKNKGLLGVAIGVIVMIITLFNNQPITGMVGMVASLIYGNRQYERGNKMQKVLEDNDLINKE